MTDELHDRLPHAQGDGDTGARVVKLVPTREIVEDWSPVELLEQLLEEIKAGRVRPKNLMVFFLQEGRSGRLKPETWSANMSYAEAIAYCELEKARVLEDWRR